MEAAPGKQRKQRSGHTKSKGVVAPAGATTRASGSVSGERSASVQSVPGQVTAEVSEATAAALATSEGESTSDPLATAWTELDLRCPTCNIIHYVPVCIFLNAAESPHLAERLRADRFNLKRCPICRKIEPVDYPFTYYDPVNRLAVQVRSEWEWTAGGGEEWYAARLEDFFDHWKDYDVRIDVVFGTRQFASKYLGDQKG